jgi:hypothetical protein
MVGVGQAPPEAAEILRLVMILLVVPPSVYMIKRLPRRPGHTMLLSSFFTIGVAHLLAVLEDLVPFRPYVDMVQHLAYGAAGVFAIAAVLAILRVSLEGRRAT